LDAIKKNTEESGGDCELTCIEPFHMPWLEKKGVRVIRNLVENVRLDAFKELNANDILFIDSSHIIRPQGDLLFIFLELLPILNPGVVVHIHDIFSPADIHEGFLFTDALLYNEQYLLEAFLTCNPRFKVIAALSYLRRHFPQLMFEKCPGMRQHFEMQEPRSFWIKRIE
ncbi:MAG TPA: class I SAM-dependent methyltransferase, partial [Chitinivibrionales bacterium]